MTAGLGTVGHCRCAARKGTTMAGGSIAFVETRGEMGWAIPAAGGVIKVAVDLAGAVVSAAVVLRDKGVEALTGKGKVAVAVRVADTKGMAVATHMVGVA